LQSVGAALGVNEDAAQKRVARALEKLRLILRRRGVTLSATALAAALASATVAPTLSATAISSTALASAGASLGLAGILNALLMTKTKLAVASVLIAAGVGGAALLQTLHAKDADNETLRQRLNELQAQLKAAQTPQFAQSELDRLRADQREAIRLRGEVQRLRDEVKEARAAQDEAQKSAANAKSTPTEAAEEVPNFRIFSSKAAGSVPPGHSILLGGWHTSATTATYAFVTPASESNGKQVSVSSKFVELDRGLAAELFNFSTNAQGNTILDPALSESIFKRMAENEGVKIIRGPNVIVAAGRQATTSIDEDITLPSGVQTPVGPKIDILPDVTAAGEISFTVEATLTTYVPK
jgi:hypothetical protein